MVWNAQNSAFAGGTNYAAYSAPNYAAYSSPNYAAYSAPNYAAYSAPNYAAYSAPNYAAYSGPNYAALPGPVAPPLAPPASTATIVNSGTGAGGASGSGFLGGYGPIARYEYATPAGLSPLPWVLDFANGDGWPPFPFELRVNPYEATPPLEWQRSDWDPALRFWSLEFDPKLTEWLQDLNLAAPAVVAAREFADACPYWLASDRAPKSTLHALFESDHELFGWRPGRGRNGWDRIQLELNELVDLMRDDRMRYLDELGVQSAQATPYFVHLMGFDPVAKPWTMELMNCATSIGNIIKMQYKSHYRRVRPSALCPALIPPWGPARHPAFPSGHSTIAHLSALFLLSVPGIAERFGVFADKKNIGTAPGIADFNSKTGQKYGEDQRSPLLWLAWRIAKGRERLGVHYSSDGAAGRWLAALVWDACLAKGANSPVKVPALRSVLAKATAEWS